MLTIARRIKLITVYFALSGFAISLTAGKLDSQEVPKASELSTDESTVQAVTQLDVRLIELLSIVSDKTTKILKREMPAYWGLVELVNKNSMTTLMQDARKNPRFNDFYSSPADHRGELVTVKMNVRRIIPCPIEKESGHGVDQLYEMWGPTDESKAWMYCVLTPTLPPGFPTEGDVNEKVVLAGYFFKLQSYFPGNSAPNSPPLLAPLIIGRVERAITDTAPQSSSSNWLMFFACFFCLAITIRILLRMRINMPSIGSSPYSNVRRKLKSEMPDVIENAAINDEGEN